MEKVLELRTKTMFDAEIVLPTWYGREDIDFQVIRVKNWKTCGDGQFVYHLGPHMSQTVYLAPADY